MGVDNVGILLDFGHALFGGESPADAAQLLIDHGRLFGMDVNDNLRGWDDDMVVGSVHPMSCSSSSTPCEQRLGWCLAARPVPVPRGYRRGGTRRHPDLKRVHRALDVLDIEGLRTGAGPQDALGAQRSRRRHYSAPSGVERIEEETPRCRTSGPRPRRRLPRRTRRTTGRWWCATPCRPCEACRQGSCRPPDGAAGARAHRW